MARLNIYDPRERAMVATADALLRPLALRRAWRPRLEAAPGRILCFRVERIGDLLMTLPALAELRALAPAATIDLAVGDWNRAIAGAIRGIDRVETLSPAWLARDGSEGLSSLALMRKAADWRDRHYDLAINFEPDIRTNIALAMTGARRTAGFASGGGGALLDLALDFEASAHTADNALALVRATMGARCEETPPSSLDIPDERRQQASRLLEPLGRRPRVGIHVSGGREIKQWPESRFRDVAEHLVRNRDAGIVLTGAPTDRAQVEIVRSVLAPERVVDLTGTDLLTTAAVIAQLDLFVTGDTGPMHLARAVETPIVAIFGPSDPRRYGPRGVRDTVVRVDLPCSPCNRIRLPPARCTGHTPACLAEIDSPLVIAEIDDALARSAR